jgi:hypothetical protein
LHRLGFYFYKKNPDGSLNIEGANKNILFNLKTKEFELLDFKMPKINIFGGSLAVLFNNIEDRNTDWLPNKITKRLKIISLFNLTDLIQNLPEEVGTSLALDLPIESLKGIGDRIKKCEMMIIPSSVKSSVLSLLKIKNLEFVGYNDANVNVDFIEAMKIINEHLNGSRRINKCKEELIEAGYKEYAKL